LLSRGGQGGFTLHETLVALALFSLGALAFVLSIGGIIRGNASSSHLTAAVHLAQDKIEELRTRAVLLPTDNCSGVTGGGEPADLQIKVTGEPGGIYSRCWKVEATKLGAGLMGVEVTVRWQERVGRTVTLATLLYRPIRQ
jgi:prepilin-type N-terminal cleavage/methylation domain-containing protein